MKVVIIGAGIAGLTLALFLEKYNIEVVINERAAGTPGGGHAFLMHHDGLSILQELAKDQTSPLPGKLVEKYCLLRPDGEVLQHLELEAWHCMKRSELTAFLYGLLKTTVQEERVFSHFVYKQEKVIAAVFENGDREDGDIFIGADGGYSRVRTEVLGPVSFKSGRVKEVVGIARQADVALKYAGIFNKFQKSYRGLAFGMIPTSEQELVWFIQYDPAVAEPEDAKPETLRAFCADLLHDFPPVVHKVLQANDYEKTYLWNTRDFDLLPKFHQDNVLVIGDAAHLALPFTSAGTTNALVDAKTLAELLRADLPYEEVFETFYEQRAASVAQHLEFGRKLRDVFLDPAAYAGQAAAIPLI
ncbi:2-polyprenyl-6-methoxyphenol hydroxylase-like FAD-dependent oxidoreductase [Pedobacter sp. CAN_A7]|uniref:FAD-dependent oxidoreductase n=1 Tax=Pedobacter sp. CAN_A7 TaxID=2787722 RepID=UPI0018C8F36A